jgi:hypothetical protein
MTDVVKNSEVKKFGMSGEKLVLLILAILTGLGTTMVYMTNKDSESLKREIEIRVSSIIEDKNEILKDIEEIKDGMSIDDKREQDDAEEKGFVKSSIKDLEFDFTNLDKQVQLSQLQQSKKFGEITERVGKIEVVLEIYKSCPKD